MKLFFTFFFILTLISAIAAEPFKMPENTQELARNESGKTWRMNGVLPLALEQGKAALMKNVANAGFKLKHEIVTDQTPGSILVCWNKGQEELIMMIWPSGKNKTVFAWGINRK